MRISGRYLRSWLTTRLRSVRRGRRIVTGKRVVVYRSGWVALEPFETLSPGADEVLVRILASTVSPGTERANYLRLANTTIRYPYSPGYSAAGIVVSAGRGCRHLQPGMVVAAHAPHASLAVVSSRSVHPLPGDGAIPMPVASLWQLGVIALQGVMRAKIDVGTEVAVIGQGVIALLAARLAAKQGARVDLLLRSAPSVPARSSARRIVQIERKGSDAVGQYEVVLDCSGDPETVLMGARCLKPRGRVILLGSNRGVTGPFDWAEVFGRREISLVGAHVQSWPRSGDGGIAALVQSFLTSVLDSSLKIDDLVGERWDPREAWRFYRALARRRAGSTGAWFDWTVLGHREACRRRSLLRGPLRWRPEVNLGWEAESSRQAV